MPSPARHIHRWHVEPVEAAHVRWEREGVRVDDHDLHARCWCGARRVFPAGPADAFAIGKPLRMRAV